jgi:hypothetical protein
VSTNLVSAIFYAAMALPPPYGENEPPDARQYRLAELAVAIDDASDGVPELASALLATAWDETRLSRKVHEKGPRKDTKGWAISLWSLHTWRLVPYAEWKTLGHIEGTKRAALVAARVLTWARARCGTVAGMFAMYATGKSCSWKGAGNRVWLYNRILRQLEPEES